MKDDLNDREAALVALGIWVVLAGLIVGALVAVL
jgi:hypothetical protein